MQPKIPMTEFARRLCKAEHPFAVERACGLHVAMAQRCWVLITDEGARALDVILQVRREEGLLELGPTTGLADLVPQA